MKWMDAQKDKPFCLMLHYTAPHAPHIPAPRHKDLFKDTVFPEPATLLDNYAGRAPEPVADGLSWSRLLQAEGGPYESLKKQFTGDRTHDTRLMYQTYVRNYLRMVAGIDENIGRLMDHLEKSGLAANTIVVYTSDNGYFLGEHGFYNKMWMYEEGSHIPLIIRMPGHHAGTTNDQIVSMIDVAPTILDLARIKVPDDIQGCSMKPLILSEPTKWRDSFYYHYYGFRRQPAKNWIASPNGEIFGIRTATTKLICYPKWKGGPFWEYFDLVTDPHEMINLVTNPARKTDVADAKKRLTELATRYHDNEVVQILNNLE